MAIQGYVNIHSKVQGPFRGNDKHEFGPECMEFSYQVTAPLDSVTGHTSGKRQHNPVKIVKEWGASSPQLFHAIFSNEVLNSVLIEFVRTNTNGPDVSYTILLKNAVISEMHHIGEDKDSVTFEYEEIAISHSTPRPGSANILHHCILAGAVPIPHPN